MLLRGAIDALKLPILTLPPEIEQRLEEGAANARAEFEANWESWKAYLERNKPRSDVTGVRLKPAAQELSAEGLEELGFS